MTVETSYGLTVDQVQAAMRPAQQNATPTAGATVVIAEAATDINVWLTPAGTIATLAIQLPTGYQGQRITIASNQAITLLSVTGATVLNGLASLSLGGAFALVRMSAGIWVRPA